VIVLVVYIPWLGALHLFDWDEINFAECAREMIVSGNYSHLQINFKPFWEKPPLFIWMQVGSMKLFGINEFAARFPNVLCGLISMLTIYYIGKKEFDEETGFRWFLFYIASLLPHFYFKSGIIDPWFNFFIFVGVYTGWKALQGKWVYVLLSAFLLGLALLTKGPVGILLGGSCLCIYQFYLNIMEKKVEIKPWLRIGLIMVLSFFLLCAWHTYDIIQHGWWMTNEFIAYQFRLLSTEDAGHGGPFFFHFLVLLFACFPASVFMLRYFSKDKPLFTSEQKQLGIVFLLLLTITLVLFSIVKTKIIHYSSLCYLPITFLAALNTGTNLEVRNMISWKQIIFYLIGIFWLILLILTPIIGSHLNWVRTTIPIEDSFLMENLNASQYWTFLHFTPALFFLLAMFLMTRRQVQYSLILFSLSIFSLMLLFTPNIESISQRAAIDFYSSKSKEDCYIVTYGFKSYAHYFYKKTLESQPDFEELSTHVQSKPVYVVAKINSMEEFEKRPFELLYSKNGFLFYRKKKNK